MKKQIIINNKAHNNVLSKLALVLGLMSISLVIYSAYMPCKSWVSHNLLLIIGKTTKITN